MSTFQTCAVLLDGEKEVYRQGEVVTGELLLDVTENVTVKGVRVYLYGQTLTKWDEYSSSRLSSTKDYVAREKYLGRVHTVFGNGQNVSGPNHTLTAGRHKYRYKFTLPMEGLPSSFEGEFGAIRYWIKVEVERPFPHFDQCWYTGITVLDDINVNDYKAPIRRSVVKQVSKALGFGNAGSLSMNAEIDRGAYCAGEKVALKVVVKNESTKDMGKLKAQLEQKIEFTAHNETKNIHNVIRILESTPIKKGEERVWDNQLLNVDAIPPSTKMRSCHVIEVRYFIRVFVEVPLGIDLETSMPVTIGTIPYGHTPATVRAPAAGGATPAAASTALRYTKCDRGVDVFDKSDGNFVNYLYTPMCAYVINYTFPPPRPTASAAAVARPRVAANTAATAPTKTASQAPVQPSAPPILPSYEDVLKMDNPNPTIEKVDKPYGLLLIRFPDGHVADFRDLIGKQQKSLAASEGELIAFAQQVIHEPHMWPPRTSIAILKFPSVEVACDWFNTTPGVADLKWMKTCDVIVAVMSEMFKKANRIFWLSSSFMRTPSPSKAELAKFFNLYKATLRPLRIWKAGVTLAATYKFTRLRGKWVENKYSFGLTQWATLDLLHQYKSERMLGPNKECYDKLLEMFDVKEGAVFQSEELSLFQYTMHSNERSDSPTFETHLGSIDSVNDSTQKEAPGGGNEAEAEAEVEAEVEAEPEVDEECVAKVEAEAEAEPEVEEGCVAKVEAEAEAGIKAKGEHEGGK